MKQVFVSYSSQEAQQANEIVEALEKQGIECWIAPRDIGIGSNYMRAIPGGIKECPFFLLVLSSNAQNSVWVEKELGQAIKQHKELFPLLIENCTIDDSFDFVLGNVQIRPYFQNRDAAIREVFRRITSVCPVSPVATPGPIYDPEIKPAPIINPELRTMSVEDIYRAALRNFEDGNFVPAAKGFQQAADRNHPGAQNMLGYCYDTGKGVTQNYDTAVLWYRKAIDNGNIPAQRHLGYCYEYGRGVELDLVEAKKWYCKANTLGDKKAAEHLKRLEAAIRSPKESAEEWFQKGQEYYNSKRYKEAVEWFRKAAGQNHSEAQNRMGDCYYLGRGIPQNYKSAVFWYQKAANQGNSNAQYNLALCYEHGRGVPKNPTNSKQLYERSTAQALAEEKKNFRTIVDHPSNQKSGAALIAHTPAVSKSASPSVKDCYQRGLEAYRNGYYFSAVTWYRKAAEQGNPDAQNRLGDCHYLGKGVPLDYKTAVFWYQKAAQLGHINAQYNLALCFEHGRGVIKSLTEAKKWYQKAADQGDENAKHALKRLK